LRNLTLGTLIVVGGTLAALPFRRSQPIEPQIPAVPTIAPAFPTLQGMLVDDREPKPEWIDRIIPEVRTPPAAWHQPRELSAPLTYEDLAVPISKPLLIEQRFNATAPVPRPHQGRLEVNLASSEMGPRTSEDEAPTSHSILDGNEVSKTILDSANLAEMRLEQLPKRKEAQREHFWIRQP